VSSSTPSRCANFPPGRPRGKAQPAAPALTFKSVPWTTCWCVWFQLLWLPNSFFLTMSYEPSFSKRPGGAASRPRFFSLLGLGSDTGESGAPSLKVIIDDESNPSSSRDAGSAVSLLRALDSAGDQVATCDSSFPPKPQTPTQKHQSVSPVAQKFGRRAAVDNKPKGEILVLILCFLFSFSRLSPCFVFSYSFCSALTVQIKSIQRFTFKRFFKPACSIFSSKEVIPPTQALNSETSVSAAPRDVRFTCAEGPTAVRATWYK
jgi:hypothetical protein